MAHVSFQEIIERSKLRGIPIIIDAVSTVFSDIFDLADQYAFILGMLATANRFSVQKENWVRGQKWRFIYYSINDVLHIV